jgi:hypothetical protein
MFQVALILGIIFGIAGTVLSFIFITPEKKREKLPKFFKFVHDLFNFKFLVIEKIMQALYIFFTIFVIIYGFFGTFSFESYFGHVAYTGWQGLLVLIFGPILVRLVYEGFMMFIILVKNTNSINAKLDKPAEKKDAE